MILLLGHRLESRLVFAARACILLGVPYQLVIEKRGGKEPEADEDDCLKWLAHDSSIEVVYKTFPYETTLQFTSCICEVRGNFSHFDRMAIVKSVSTIPRTIGMLRFTANSLFWQMKQIIKEYRSPFYSAFTELWTEDVNIWLIRKILRKSHRFYGAVPHQRCSIIPKFWNMLAAVANPGERPFLFSCSATANFKRDPIAMVIEAMLSRIEGSQYWLDVPSHSVAGRVRERALWNYDRPGQHRPRPFELYLAELDSAWFTLCIPGYTGTTNRVLESLLRGSIPVLLAEQVPYHGIALKDGVNSILVKDQDWCSTIKRLAHFTLEERLAMQRQVIALAESSASLNSIAAKLISHLKGLSHDN
jgi:hypothetical protein